MTISMDNYTDMGLHPDSALVWQYLRGFAMSLPLAIAALGYTYFTPIYHPMVYGIGLLLVLFLASTATIRLTDRFRCWYDTQTTLEEN